MKINRDLYLKPIKEDEFQLPCPNCDKGLLEIEKETFVSKNTAISEKEYNITEEISSLDSKFFAFLRCNNRNCREIVRVSGNLLVDEYDTCDCYPDQSVIY